MPNKGYIRKNVYIAPSEYEEIKALLERTSRSFSGLARNLMVTYARNYDSMTTEEHMKWSIPWVSEKEQAEYDAMETKVLNCR